MAPRKAVLNDSVLALLRHPGILMGMLGCVLAHTRQYALFSYSRPALESVTNISVDGLSLMLLGFGVANFCGTLLAGELMQRSLCAMFIIKLALVGIAAFGTILLPVEHIGLMVLVALWGSAFGGVPVAWPSWIARVLPDHAEMAGGMIVATCSHLLH